MNWLLLAVPVRYSGVGHWIGSDLVVDGPFVVEEPVGTANTSTVKEGIVTWPSFAGQPSAGGRIEYPNCSEFPLELPRNEVGEASEVESGARCSSITATHRKGNSKRTSLQPPSRFRDRSLLRPTPPAEFAECPFPAIRHSG